MGYIVIWKWKKWMILKRRFIDGYGKWWKKKEKVAFWASSNSTIFFFSIPFWFFIRKIPCPTPVNFYFLLFINNTLFRFHVHKHLRKRKIKIVSTFSPLILKHNLLPQWILGRTFKKKIKKKKGPCTFKPF